MDNGERFAHSAKVLSVYGENPVYIFRKILFRAHEGLAGSDFAAWQRNDLPAASRAIIRIHFFIGEKLHFSHHAVFVDTLLAQIFEAFDNFIRGFLDILLSANI
jgi:hypothetical protein